MKDELGLGRITHMAEKIAFGFAWAFAFFMGAVMLFSIPTIYYFLEVAPPGSKASPEFLAFAGWCWIAASVIGFVLGLFGFLPGTKLQKGIHAA